MLLSDAIIRYQKYLRNIRNATPYTLTNYTRSLDLLQETVGEIDLEKLFKQILSTDPVSKQPDSIDNTVISSPEKNAKGVAGA